MRQWIRSSASPTDLDSLVMKGKVKKTFAEMVKEIENNKENNTGMLSMIKSKAWSGMSGYVHTGMVQLSRHNTDKTIEPDFRVQEIIQMLNLANGFGLLAGLWLNSASGSTDHLNQFEKKMTEYNDYSEDILNSFKSNS